MKNLFILFSLVLSIALYAEDKIPEKNKEETPNYQTVKPAIEGAIAALEAKDTEKFFKEFVSPKDIQSLKETEGAYEKATSEFMKGEKAGALLIALKKLKDMTPVYNKEKDVLVFKDEKMHALTFSRENGKWYIKN